MTAESALETQDAALGARIEVAARTVADLDQRLVRSTPLSRRRQARPDQYGRATQSACGAR
jgi:hypothetical protein